MENVWRLCKHSGKKSLLIGHHRLHIFQDYASRFLILFLIFIVILFAVIFVCHHHRAFWASEGWNKNAHGRIASVSMCLLGFLASVAHLLFFPRICNAREGCTQCPTAARKRGLTRLASGCSDLREGSCAVIPRQQCNLFCWDRRIGQWWAGVWGNLLFVTVFVFMFGERESFVSLELKHAKLSKGLIKIFRY